MTTKAESVSIRCEVCNLNVNSQLQYEAHLQGKSHQKKLVTLGHTHAGEVSSIPKAKLPLPLMGSFIEAAEDVTLETHSDKECDVFFLPKAGMKRKAGVYFCAICDLGFNSEDQASSHFSGSKHSKKLKAVECMNQALKTGFVPPLLPPPPPPPVAVTPVVTPPTPTNVSSSTGFYCSFCDLHLNSPQQLAQHREGTKHLKQVNSKSYVQEASPDPSPAGGESPVEYTKQFTCNTCCMSMNNVTDFRKHKNSHEHWKRLEEITDLNQEYTDSYHGHQQGEISSFYPNTQGRVTTSTHTD